MRNKEKLEKALQKRVARCNYLRERYDALKHINFEQAEAYAARINWHKPKILESLEELERL